MRTALGEPSLIYTLMVAFPVWTLCSQFYMHELCCFRATISIMFSTNPLFSEQLYLFSFVFSTLVFHL